MTDLDLLRTAVLEGSEDAWEALYVRLRPQMEACAVYTHRGYEDGVQALVERAFARFWRAMTPERVQAFDNFAPAFAYIRRCIQGEAIDNARWRHAPSEPISTDVAHVVDLDSEIYAHLVWATVRPHLDDNEWLIIRAKYYAGMPYRQILQAWPGQFTNATEVCNIERRARSRLSHRIEVRALWEAL